MKHTKRTLLWLIMSLWGLFLSPARGLTYDSNQDPWFKRWFANTYFACAPLGVGVAYYDAVWISPQETAILNDTLYLKTGGNCLKYQFPYDVPACIFLPKSADFSKNKLQVHPHYVRGHAYKFPFAFRIFWDMGGRFRLGIGLEVAAHYLNSFAVVRECRRILKKSKIPDSQVLAVYKLPSHWFFSKILALHFGYKIMDHSTYGGFIVENHIGILLQSPQLFASKSSIMEPYISLGLTYERHFSARWRWFVSTHLQLLNWIDFLKIGQVTPLSFYGKAQVQAQAGFIFNFTSRFPRCPVQHCHATTQHYHGGILYRP